MVIYCPNCGKENDDDTIFCSSCGSRINGPVNNIVQTNTYSNLQNFFK